VNVLELGLGAALLALPPEEDGLGIGVEREAQELPATGYKNRINPSYSQTRWAKTIPRLARPC
jgi:hypothetical protein